MTMGKKKQHPKYSSREEESEEMPSLLSSPSDHGHHNVIVLQRGDKSGQLPSERYFVIERKSGEVKK